MVGVTARCAVRIPILPPLRIVIAIALPPVEYTFFYFVSCLFVIAVPAIAMQLAIIAMLVLLLSVVLNIFYFAAAVTATYSAVADADDAIVSVFVAASVATSRFSSHCTHAMTTAELLFIAFSLPIAVSSPPVN